MTTINTNSPPQTNIQKQDKYKDPLNSWNIKWMSYSDEFGTAISEIAPKLGAALWVPSFMYLGADIYDKYKNDKNSYNPSKRRAVERSIYQGISNLVALPALISLGQRIVPPLGKLYDKGLSITDKDAVFKLINQVMAQGVNNELDNKESFTQLIKTTLENKITSQKTELKHDGFFKKLYKTINYKYSLAKADKSKIMKFAQQHAEELFEIKEALKSGKHSKNIPFAVKKTYLTTLNTMKDMHGFDFSNNALRSALIEVGKNRIFTNKLLKTAGGFASLFLFGPTVSKFVEKKLVGEYLDSGINYAYENLHTSKIKTIFNEMKSKSV